MKLKATDSFHTGETGQVHAREEFDVSDSLAKDLQAKGLAEPIGAAKAARTSRNKAAPTAKNK